MIFAQIKRILSFLWPFTKTYESQHSGMLEVTWINGEKHLNTKIANYSYGALQRVLAFGLRQIKFEKSAALLVLGMGGGSVLASLRKSFAHCGKITAVEFDEKIVQLAEREYGWKSDEHLKIVTADAQHFLLENTQKYDLIIIDLFIDAKVPLFCFEENFWHLAAAALPKGGQVLFNAGLQQKQKTELENLLPMLQKSFRLKIFDQVNEVNTLLIAEKAVH